MSELPHDGSDEVSRLDRILADYMQAAEAGRAPDRQSLLAEHPDLEPELRAFFEEDARFRALAGPLKDTAPTPTPAALQKTVLAQALHEQPPGAASADENPAASFGDYELICEVGRGAMGVVYWARQKSLNRWVALKMVLAGRFASQDDIQRFRTEALAAAALEHPNIVTIYEVGECEGRQFFSMRLIEGKSLKGHMPDLGTDPSRAARMIVRIARAVHFAHQHGILHRDLKPANILVDSRGEPFVTDFGLAKRVQEDDGMTQTGQIVGTATYMAPEQASGQSKRLTTAADVYSLGAILYEMLTGQCPFTDTDLLALLMKVQHEEPRPPSALNRRLDRDLDTICLKCLSKDPAGRYSSANELADDLDRWLGDLPIHARPTPIHERVRKWVRRHPAATAWVLFGVIAASAGTAGAIFWNAWAARQEAETARYWYPVLQDDFSSPDVATRYVFAGGLVDVTDGHLCIRGGRPNMFFLNQSVPGDVRIEFRCRNGSRKSEDSAELLAFVSAVPASGRAELLDKGYEGAWGDGRLAIRRHEKTSAGRPAAVSDPWQGDLPAFGAKLSQQKVTTVRSVSAPPIHTGVWHDVRIERTGTRITWSVDGRSVSFDDPAPHFGPDRTAVGCGGHMAETHWDDLRVYRLGPPLKGDFLETAERYLGQGDYPAAKALFEEVAKATNSAERARRASDGLRRAETELGIAEQLKKYGFLVDRIWGQYCAAGTTNAAPRLRRSEGLLALNLEGVARPELASLAGLELNRLSLRGTTVTNLAMLRGMPLTVLNLENTPVTDLSPLSGMPLTSLHIGGCPITDLSPLRHMKTLTTVGIDPSTILFRPANEATAAGNRAGTTQELKKVIADWSDVPAMKTCVDRAKALLGRGDEAR